tara:strand:- start:5738 stop:6190 length:453 start_codon:yes stop_codon:yes gene_type:complete
MPTYSFRCRECGEFDLQRKATSAGRPAKCPECREVADRIFTSPTIVCASEGGWDSNNYKPDDRPFVPDNGMSPDKYEAKCKNRIAEERAKARVSKRSMRNVRRKEDIEWKKVAVIPPELHQAEMTRTGNPMAWLDGGEELMRKTGTWIDD